MSKELGVDFYFGDKMVRPPQRLQDYMIPGFKKVIHNHIIFWPLYWQSGVVSLLFKPYSAYITMGNIWCISTWLVLILGRLFSKKKFFLWSHGWYGDESLMKCFIKNIFYSFAHDVFVYGEYSKGLMVKKGFNSENIHVIYNSLDYKVQLTQRSKLSNTDVYLKHYKNSYPNLIFIGRLNPVKKLDMIVYAIHYLMIKYNFKVNLTLIGDGENKNLLLNLSMKNKLNNNLWFYGPCYNEDEISELIFNADLCVSPGNVGLTAMHSMVYGTPVITHNNFPKQVPEFEAIIDGLTGCFFEYGNYISLAEKIMNWLEYSSSQRKTIRNACYRVIDQKYNPHYQICVLKKVLSKNNCL